MKEALLDSWRGVVRRPQRTVLTTLGVALGVGALVAIVGLAESASVQISLRFDAIAATALEVTLPPSLREVSDTALSERAAKISGVRMTGTFTTINPLTAPPVTAASVRRPGRGVPVIVASSLGLRAAEPALEAGTLPTAWAESRDPRLAVVGVGIAREFAVSPGPGRNLLRLNGLPFIVVGVISDRTTQAVLSRAVVVSPAGGDLLFPEDIGRVLLVRTVPGASQQAAEALPLALHPQDPSEVVVDVPPDPVALRGRISTDTKNLLLALAVVTLAGGALGIANTMLISVMERMPEIGVRRALGASRQNIASLFLVESMIVGSSGGLMGTAVGILLGALLSFLRSWPYVLPPAILMAPLLGTTVGVVAGLYPSVRASTANPVDSLRS